MSENTSPAPLPLESARSSWPKALALFGCVAVLVFGGVWLARELIHAPAKAMQAAGTLLQQGGSQLRSVAQAFQEGVIRTEFMSRAVEIAGTSRFQFATLKQGEVFKREESGSIAWGTIPLPKVVVQAQAPVEYGYYVDFNGRWEFLRDNDTVVVSAPPIMANTPALDVSALTFYTLEGSIWRDEEAVREKLRQSLSGTLLNRALENRKLVREVGRQRIADFVEKWLAEKFSDGKRFHVKVVFADEHALREEAPRS